MSGNESLEQVGHQAASLFCQRKNAERTDAGTRAEISRLRTAIDSLHPARIRTYEDTLRQMEEEFRQYPDEEEHEAARTRGRTLIEQVGSDIGKAALRIAEITPRLGDFERATEAAAQHFHEHEGEYYDLAVLEATHEGVQLRLETPVFIGTYNALSGLSRIESGDYQLVEIV